MRSAPPSALDPSADTASSALREAIFSQSPKNCRGKLYGVCYPASLGLASTRKAVQGRSAWARVYPRTPADRRAWKHHVAFIAMGEAALVTREVGGNAVEGASRP